MMDPYQTTSNQLYWIAANQIEPGFPDPDQALTQPNGLLAVGGDLSLPRLLEAYRKGIFPWYEGHQPILWWSPDPRMILLPGQIKVSRSLRRTLKHDIFRVTVDQAFEAVMRGCAEPRRDQEGTWLTGEMVHAYTRLYIKGHAHSVECWYEDSLVGGLYGVAVGQVFFGESMFSRLDDASKVALVKLTQFLLQWGYQLIDCQIYSDHLQRLGAFSIPRSAFIQKLNEWCPLSPHPHAWQMDHDTLSV
jgi:leucyl/phenylalanyl-tRNA---protein transferase